MREILVYLSHCCFLYVEICKQISFYFAFLNAFTSLAVGYYSTLVKDIFCFVYTVPCFNQTFSSIDGIFRKQSDGFLLRKKLPKFLIPHSSFLIC